MNQNYSDLIEQISHLLCKTIVEQEPNLGEKLNQLDGDLFSLLRAIGLKVMSKLLALIIDRVTNQEKQPGFVVHRRPKIKYTVIFGQLKERISLFMESKTQERSTSCSGKTRYFFWGLFPQNETSFNRIWN